MVSTALWLTDRCAGAELAGHSIGPGCLDRRSDRFGKTLAAFLSCIDALFQQALLGELDDRTHVVYVSPLKALSNDVQKNLQQPLAEIG